MKKIISVEKSMRLMLLIAFVVNGSSTSTFPICYGKCMFFCLVFGSKITCALQCLLQCYIENEHGKQTYYCNLGCAVNQCAKYGKRTFSSSSSLYLFFFLLSGS